MVFEDVTAIQDTIPCILVGSIGRLIQPGSQVRASIDRRRHSFNREDIHLAISTTRCLCKVIFYGLGQYSDGTQIFTQFMSTIDTARN